MSADNRSKPYFFSFETKKKAGKFIAHCVRFETLELDEEIAGGMTFTLFGADIENDPRIGQLIDIAKKR